MQPTAESSHNVWPPEGDNRRKAMGPTISKKPADVMEDGSCLGLLLMSSSMSGAKKSNLLLRSARLLVTIPPQSEAASTFPGNFVLDMHLVYVLNGTDEERPENINNDKP